jgi:hypothetical protein
MKKNNNQANNTSQDEVMTYERVKGQENVVRITSYNDGKKHVVYVYALSEEQFESLLPLSEKPSNSLVAVAG